MNKSQFWKNCVFIQIIYKILQNKIRRKVNLISLKNPIKDNTININNKNGIKNNILSDEYNCFICKFKNQKENKICVKCGYNNDEYLKNINKNKKYIKNIPKNIFKSK